MTKKQKMMLAGLGVVLVFFGITFSKNWGAAVSENLLEKFKPEVKSLKDNRQAALARCPYIISKLEKGIPELEKSKDKTQAPLAKKLVADCAFAAGDYARAAEFYQKLVTYEPNVARWHAGVAESYLRQGRQGDALRPSILATQLDPASFDFRLLNARVLAKLELKNRALEAYAKAIRIAPYQAIQSTREEFEKYLSRVEGLTEDEQLAVEDDE